MRLLLLVMMMLVTVVMPEMMMSAKHSYLVFHKPSTKTPSHVFWKKHLVKVVLQKLVYCLKSLTTITIIKEETRRILAHLLQTRVMKKQTRMLVKLAALDSKVWKACLAQIYL